MHEITLKSLQQEVVRAESERETDKQKFINANLPDPRSLPKIKYSFIATDDVSSGILTCQNQREYQEDRADVIALDIDPSLSIIERAVLLQNLVAILSHCLKDEKAGSTLVLNLSWQDEFNIHILAANLGDSRSILCNLTKNTVTRLTCDHTMLRENEQDNVVSRGYALLKKGNEMFIMAKESKIVGVQKKSYLYPAGEGKPGLQMTRSLGDNPLHSQSEVFNRTPALSYICAPKTEKCYLLSSSDGVTDCVSDDEVLKILELNSNRSYATRLCRIAQTAIFRGSHDNITSVITSISYDTPSNKIRLQFVADGHSGNASSEFIHQNIKECFVLATRYRQEYLEQKKKLMPREARYLENIFRFTETGLLTFQQGMEHINFFHKLEGLCKRIIENDPKKSIFLDYIPHSMMNDGEIKIAFDRFKTGEITAQEAVFLFLKRAQTLQLSDDHRKFLVGYKKKKIVLCDPNSSEFVKGIDDATSVCQGITAMINVITTRMTNKAAKIEGLLKKNGAIK
ncbi:MAG: hypothetical protein SFW07_06185 [Gammaproteobacteria bacterium]|nr:hypothetical protein [Gammaproteobacteria bacterium]